MGRNGGLQIDFLLDVSLESQTNVNIGVTRGVQYCFRTRAEHRVEQVVTSKTNCYFGDFCLVWGESASRVVISPEAREWAEIKYNWRLVPIKCVMLTTLGTESCVAVHRRTSILNNYICICFNITVVIPCQPQHLETILRNPFTVLINISICNIYCN